MTVELEPSVLPPANMAIRIAANELFNRYGIVTLPATSPKKPAVKWEHLQDQSPTSDEWSAIWNSRPTSPRIWAVTKPSEVVIIDCDDRQAVHFWRQRLGAKLKETGRVKTHHGWHFWFRRVGDGWSFHDIDAKQGQGKWTARILGGCVVPPSPNTNGGHYQWVEGHGPETMADITWDEMRDLAGPSTSPPSNGQVTTMAGPALLRTYAGQGTGCKWGTGLLRDEAKEVRQTESGGRDNRLAKASRASGNAISGGCLDREAAEAELFQAAVDNLEVHDKGDDRVWTTIRTNIDDGMKRPRSCGKVHARELVGDGTEAELVELIGELRTFMELESSDYVLFGLAVAVSAKLDGDPLWGMIVGSSSGGKTEVVRGLDDVADEKPDELTPAGLLSWMPPKGKREGRVVGLLTRVPSKAFVTLGDFSNILAQSDRGMRDQLFSLLRRAYDGRTSRNLGQIEQPLEWEGRLSMLAAVTSVIDTYSSHANALGPRWLFYRLNQRDLEGKRRVGQRALGREQLEEHRKRARDLSTRVVLRARGRIPEKLPERLDAWIGSWALLACYGRAGIVRDSYGAREIISFPEIEDPPRLAGQLQMLGRCLMALGVTEAHVAEIIKETALSSMPQARRKAMEVLTELESGDCVSTGAVARRIGSSRRVSKESLEELEAVGITNWIGSDRDATPVSQYDTKNWFLTNEEVGLLVRELLGRGYEPDRLFE